MWWVALTACWLTDAEIGDKAEDPRVADSALDSDPDTAAPGPIGVADLRPGDLVITEILRNPDAVDDDTGEWLEVFNPGARAIDLADLWFVDDGRDAWRAPAWVLDPGAFVVVGASLDRLVNGGAPVALRWDHVALANGADEITLKGPDDVTIDRVSWGSDDPGQAGFSQSLDPGRTGAGDNDDVAAWCEPLLTFGDGDHGTPGAANPRCP